MGKASSSKKVARAASTGGGRTSRGRRPVGYYSFIFVVVLLGSLLIVVSRNDMGNQASAEAPTTKDHWHQAFGIYICDAYIANPSDEGSDRVGIHTHADGLIHIHPFTNRASGRGAVLSRFTDQIGMELSATKLKAPGQKTKENGDKCGDNEGRVRLVEWESAEDTSPQFVGGDPGDYRLRHLGVVVMAFIAEDAKPESVPMPASIAELASPSDLEPTSSTVPESSEGGSTSTTAPSESTTSSSTP